VFVTVRYTACFAKPYVGAKVVGTVERVSHENGQVNVICTLEGGLQATVEEIGEDRYTLKSEMTETYSAKPKDSESEVSSDEDSIFQDRPQDNVRYSLFDRAKQREIQQGTKVKVQITKVIVTDESIISTVKFI
jgi:hypothetical protein